MEQMIKDSLVDNFNLIIGEFTRKLIVAYPSDKIAFTSLYNKILLGISADKALIIETMAAKVDTFKDDILAHEDALFEGDMLKLPMFSGVDMAKNWKVSPQPTKDAIWGYLESLVKLSGAYTNGVVIPSPESQEEKDSHNTRFDLISADPEFLAMCAKLEQTKPDPSRTLSQVAGDVGIDLDCLKGLDIASLVPTLVGTLADVDGVDPAMVQELRATLTKELCEMQASAEGQ